MNIVTDWIMGHHQTKVSTRHRAMHTYVVGQSGTGKSRAIESWVMQDIAADRGVGVIDPHGDLFRNLLHRLAAKPETWERIVILDPLDPLWIVGFNPLEAVANLHPERLALYMTDVSAKIWHLSHTNTPRLVWLLTNSFLALSSLGLSLLDLPRFLVDRAYREALIPRIGIETARNYFQYEFPKSEAAVHQWVTPVLNKIGGLIFDPDIQLMFAGNRTINFKKIMDNQLILLVNLPKGVLGEGPSSLMAAFIVSHIQKAALARAEEYHRTPYYLYLDEFQNYTTDNIKDILSESRKYALSLTLAHQYLDQLPRDLLSAVLNTAGTLVSFRVGYRDATRLAREIFPSPDFIQTFKPDVQFRRSHQIPIPSVTGKSTPMGWGGLTLELANLRLREFWSRKRGPYKPVKQYSFNMPDPEINPCILANEIALRDEAGSRYGKLKSKIRDQMDPQTDPINYVSDIPDWSD